jgi:hypothetical protein
MPDMGAVAPYEDLFGSREGSRSALVKKLEADMATREPADRLEEGKGDGDGDRETAGRGHDI